MLKLNINDTIYLTRENASVFDKVESIKVSADVDGNQAVVKVYLLEIGAWFDLVPTSTYNQTYGKFWSVDEINGSAPEYTTTEQANA